MFFNYLKTGIRNILRYKMFSLINIFGLAVAMSVCMLIILMLADQKSYDQFHVKKDHIYRILSGRENSKSVSATTPFPLANSLTTEIPFIGKATQLTRGIGGDVTYNQRTMEMRGYFADTSFFDVFSYELEKGNPHNALILPNSMVITSEYAHQLFNEENPIGQKVSFVDRGLPNLGEASGLQAVDWGLYTITGVIAEKGYKSHLKFDVLVSSSSMDILYRENKISDRTNNWVSNHCYTYALLNPGKESEDLTIALNELAARKYADQEDAKGGKLTAQKLSEITPGIIVSNEASYSLPLIAYYVLALLALVIMISACLNYTNLSIARALTRAREIGIRKVTGALKKDLIYQFLSESIITALLAMVLGILLLLLVKPAFEGLWINHYLNFDLQENVTVYLIFIGFALIIGFVAGVFPALHLSRYRPIKVLKNYESMRPGKLGLRKVLNASQFVISLFFITTSILIYSQFRHFLEFEYEFNTRNIVNVPLQGNDYQKVLNEFKSVPGVTTVSSSDIIPATGTENGINIKEAGREEEYKTFNILRANGNFINNFGLKLIAGKDLSAAGEVSRRYVLLNEAAVKELGYAHPSEAIGQIFDSEYHNETLEVAGVVEDFRFKILINGDAIPPLVIRNEPETFSYVNVQIGSENIAGTITGLEAKWKEIDPSHSFKYEFFDDQLTSMYQGFFDIVYILGFIAFLAITIACLGMLGMATYTVERRTKEVGIRKALGAGDLTIAFLLSREFVKILLISIFVAVPLSYVINNLWLQQLPNRVEFGFGTLLLGIIVLLTLGLVTIMSQSISASRRKPVDSLRLE